MQVVSQCKSGHPCLGDHLPCVHLIALLDQKLRTVAVECVEAKTMVDQRHIPINTVLPCKDNFPRVGGNNIGHLRAGKIVPHVIGFGDDIILTAVVIIAVVTKTGYLFAVLERVELFDLPTVDHLVRDMFAQLVNERFVFQTHRFVDRFELFEPVFDIVVFRIAGCQIGDLAVDEFIRCTDPGNLIAWIAVVERDMRFSTVAGLVRCNDLRIETLVCKRPGDQCCVVALFFIRLRLETVFVCHDIELVQVVV